MLNEKVYCGVDIGGQRLKVALSKVSEDKTLELLGVFEKETYGYKDGAVSDLGELSESIHSTIQELTKKLDVKVKDVYLGLSGEMVSVRNANTIIPLVDRGNKIIARRDVNKASEQAQLLGVKVDEEALHNIAQHFIVDDDNFAINPVGLYGRKLGVQSLMIVSESNSIRNVIKAVNQSGLEVSGTYFTALISADAVLTEQEKNDGAVLIDMGAKSTTVLIFKENVIKSIQQIKMGGDDLTNAIAEKLNIPFDLSEQIKKSYASAFQSEEQSDEEILVKRENSYFPIKREDIHAALESKLDQFVNELTRAVAEINHLKNFGGGVIMVGGGALLPGLIERIAQQTHLNVGLAKVHLKSDKGLTNAASFAAAVGLSMRGIVSDDADKSNGEGQSSWAKSLANKVSELYQEYF